MDGQVTHFGYICKKLPEANDNINKLNIVLKEMGRLGNLENFKK